MRGEEGYIPDGLHPRFVSPAAEGGWLLSVGVAPLTALNVVLSPRIARKAHTRPGVKIYLTSGQRFIQTIGIVSDLKESEEGTWVRLGLARGRWAIAAFRRL